VAVLGAGVSGLTSAITLLEAGHRVRVVAAEPSATTTSALAAAVWFPTHVGPPDRVLGWGGSTFRTLLAQAAAGVPGVVMRESLALYRDPPPRPDWADAVGRVRPAAPGELPPGYRHGLRFAVPLVEMPVHLPWLVDRVRALGGEFVYRRVRTLGELVDADTDVVVNCAGLAARELVGDRSVYPVRGRILRVRNPGLTVSVRDEQHPGGRAYVHPRADDCILGGTLDEGEWDTAVDPAAGAAILDRCCDLVPQLRGATVLEQVVGLRPGRPSVRLEQERGRIGGARVVHNYGHGGSGITLSWGCAREVADLVGARRESAG
jgi:D-amino-acid oxidase